jgi:hypothetical protein
MFPGKRCGGERKRQAGLQGTHREKDGRRGRTVIEKERRRGMVVEKEKDGLTKRKDGYREGRKRNGG